MELDSARNAKTEILRKAFGFVEHGGLTIRSTPIFRVDPTNIQRYAARTGVPMFRAKGMARATPGTFRESEINAHLAPPVAIGISPQRGDRNKLLLLGTERRLARHPVVEQALSIARGEAEFVWTGANQRLSYWQPPRQRPLAPGLSVAHVNVSAGTLGGFVAIGAGKVGILSNNHVLADVNRGVIGECVLQPGKRDGGTLADVCGHLHSFVNLDASPGAVNTVDCAVASLADGIEPSWALLAPEGVDAPKIAGPAEEAAFVGDDLFKIGRTTGLTWGKVFAIEVDNYIVNMGSAQRPLFCRFDNQFQVYSEGGDFARRGDSGSLVVDRDGQVYGLLFAGSTKGAPGGYSLTSVNPIGEVLSQLNTRLWIS